MSQENVEVEDLAHETVDALNREDLDGFLSLVHPEAEFTSMIAEAEGETFRGHDGVRRWWKSVRMVFTEVHWSYDLVRARGDRVVVMLRIHGILSGIDVVQTMWQAVVLRDGKAVWWAFFRTKADALEAVGLSEQDPLADS
jgi:ketosteroid isomerase-like protein